MAKAKMTEADLEKLLFTPEELKSIAAMNAPSDESPNVLGFFDATTGLVLFWVVLMSFVYYWCARSRLLLLGHVHPDSYEYYVSKNTGEYFRYVLPFFAIVGIACNFFFDGSLWLTIVLVLTVIASMLNSKKYH